MGDGPATGPGAAVTSAGGGALAVLRLSGDLSTKARATRRHFQRRLLRNLRDALAAHGGSIRDSRDRLFADLPCPEAAEPLQRVFGIQSISLVEQRAAVTLEGVAAEGEEIFRERVRGRRFAVRARRVGDRSRIALRGSDVQRALGAALLPVSAGVDLSSPEVSVHVELHGREAYFFSESATGPGGLPLGVEGRAVALVSGGFDSAVAAWQIARRGVSIEYVFCNLGGEIHRQGTLRVLKVLSDRWSYGDRPRLQALDFEPVARELQERTDARYWQVLLKRQMLRAAELVADARGAAAIVTGDAVGQVSSQTLQNLDVISRASRRTVLRPLVGLNKEEIIALARHVGTYELSKVVGEYCAMVPRRPATRARLEAVLAQEQKLDPSLLERIVTARAEIDLRAFDLGKLELPEIELRSLPEGASLIDLRSRDEYQTWHHPDALQLDFGGALRAYPSFDRARTYVLYCEFGLMSAQLAELMRRDGFDAYHFRGGVPALRKASEG